jgi:hypothetical protein
MTTPHDQDLTRVRSRFHEAGWATWNRVRAAATAAFVSLAWSLILYGQATA